MRKRIAAILAATAFIGTLALAPAASADPSGCNCVWMATGYNPESGEFTYEWVCPTVLICQIQVEP